MTMSVSVYAPGANEYQGGLMSASGKTIQDGHAACGFSFPFGTVFEVTGSVADELKKRGISTRVACADRGGAVKDWNLDIALVSGDARLKRAYDFGRRKAEVIITLPVKSASNGY
jgi:soluble P-type ATPase